MLIATIRTDVAVKVFIIELMFVLREKNIGCVVGKYEELGLTYIGSECMRGKLVVLGNFEIGELTFFLKLNHKM